MLKYLQDVFTRLSGQKSGITANSAAWTGQPDTPATVQTDMDSLTTVDGEIDALEDQLNQKRLEARALASTLTDKADATELRAKGIHATAPGKLQEYNIALPAEGTAQPIPGKSFIKRLTDDDDGIGFKVSIQPLAGATFFEVERGRSQPTGPFPQPNPTPPSTTVMQPPFDFLRSTKKLVFVDDDIEPNFRYHYRVRGVNAAGPGEWSEPVSGVQ